jgi:hypothetical protein
MPALRHACCWMFVASLGAIALAGCGVKADARVKEDARTEGTRYAAGFIDGRKFVAAAKPEFPVFPAESVQWSHSTRHLRHGCGARRRQLAQRCQAGLRTRLPHGKRVLPVAEIRGEGHPIQVAAVHSLARRSPRANGAVTMEYRIPHHRRPNNAARIAVRASGPSAFCTRPSAFTGLRRTKP